MFNRNSYKMKYPISATILLLFMMVLISCNKNEDEEINENSYDCIFEQNDNDMDGMIDESERMIMNECMENSLSSKNSIENNLIGEWELIGHGEGWIPSKSQPCGYIIISEDELTFEFRDNNTNIVSTHQWEVEEVNWNGSQNFRLNILPESVEGLSIGQFCENYIYGDATPRDGNMYLYKKVD